MRSSLSLRDREMDKESICRAICEIRCVCVLLDEGDEIGIICKAMAENIIKTIEETPQNSEHLSESPIG